MYGWIWRNLPGDVGVRTVFALVMLLAAVAVLMFGVFPWIEPYLPFSDVTMDQ